MTDSPFINIVADCLGDSGHRHLIQSIIQKSLRKKVDLQGPNVFSSLPIVEMEIIPGDFRECSIFLICLRSSGVDKFFNELLSKWLLPGQRLSSHFFIHSSFSISTRPLEKLSFCEMRFLLHSGQELEGVVRNFAQIVPEIKLGASSAYQAHKILEHRGLFSSEKNSLIQDRVASLIQKRPEDFDYDVFGQMQHFFLSSKEGFKKIREHPHLSRIVYVFYLFRKRIKKVTEKIPDKRHVSFKVNHVRLHRSFGMQKVLGIFVGINFLKKHELFEEHHLEKAIQEQLPDALVVEGSLFVYLHKEERIQILYLEIQKEGDCEFSSLDVQLLRKKFPFALENQVEKLMPTLFMPRNEEEVMKNIIRLSQELKYIKDIPQVFISFEEQADIELTFTIVLLRVLLEKEASIQKLFKKTNHSFCFIEDRVKHVGLIRGKYPKEATVFRLKLPKSFYKRSDHSVDLLKARHAVVESIELAVGEFRDYNGGMISKQSENLKTFKSLLLNSCNEIDSEGFFHSIYPVEMRSLVNPSLLKVLYDEWQKMLTQEDSFFDFSVHLEKSGMVLMTRFFNEEIKGFLAEGIKELNLSSSQWVVFLSKKGLQYYQGYLLLSTVPAKGAQLLDCVQKIQSLVLSPV